MDERGKKQVNTLELWAVGLLIAVVLVWAGKRYFDYLEDKKDSELGNDLFRRGDY